MDITITLNQNEILASICNFLRAKNVVTDDKNIEINLVAGRGANGHSAVISIKDGEANGIDTTMASAKLVTTEPDATVPAPAQRRTRTTTKTQPEPTASPAQSVIPDPPAELVTAAIETEPDPMTVVPTETMSANEMSSNVDESGVADALFATGEEAENNLFSPAEPESLFS